MFEKSEAAIKLLDQLYDVIKCDNDRSNKIRSWCITIWMATLAIVSTGKLTVTLEQKYILSLLPIIMFWLLDGFQNSFILMHSNRAKELENIISNGTYDNLPNDEYFFISGHRKLSFRSKIKALITSLFLRETVTVFYFLLCVSSFVFVYVGANYA